MSIFRRMQGFLKMWLILRALSDQLRYTARSTENLEERFSAQQRPYVDRAPFAIMLSNTNLLFFLLPRPARYKLRPKSLVRRNTKTINKAKLVEMNELLDCAEADYVATPDAGDIEEGAYPIRLTTNPKEGKSGYGIKFITVFGGLEELVRKFPASWAIIALALIPWVLAHLSDLRDMSSGISPW